MDWDGKGVLEIKRIEQLKTFLLLNIDFIKVPEEVNRKIVMFKYAQKMAQVEILESWFQEILKIISWKNPALL